MAEPDDVDEDLFADLYEGDDNDSKPAEPALSESQTKSSGGAAQIDTPDPVAASVEQNLNDVMEGSLFNNAQPEVDSEPQVYGENIYGHDGTTDTNSLADTAPHVVTEHGFTGTVGIKEDGKMFIGGLNWETTDQSLRDYFSQFGEVLECTVMRDGATGRSRGFGFLTFKDPKTVNIVMVKEHYLDGKIIDPKRAIPRDEQEKTSKIFVGGVSQEATERDFESFFSQFGRVIDATLMMDKDTGRPRGFGFVTFEGEAAVEATLAQPLEILGKPIEVKKAQPRGNLREEDEGGRNKFGRRGQNDRFGRGQDGQGGASDNQVNQTQQNQGQQQGQGQQQPQQQNGQGMNNMSPQMMAQYWQKMQQYFAMMQQQMAANMGGPGQGMGGNMNMGGANPAMMQQMMAMQGMNRGQNGSPGPQNSGAQGMGGMSPAMMQQMAQMQQMQQMQQQQQQQQPQPQPQQANQANGAYPRITSPSHGAPNLNRPGYTAQEQLAFEQRKYEQQQARRMGQPYGGNGGGHAAGYNQGSPSSWEGMYDDVPQPNAGNQGGRGRGGQRGQGTPQPPQQNQAPANAPTGPKNAGKPGANYRGGGRGGHRGFHPYARN